jgi:transcriptional regulator with XRE-family HTH domain
MEDIDMEKIPAPPPTGPQPEFGEKLKAWREVAGLSQQDMADLLDISKGQIIRWESQKDHRQSEPTGSASQRYEAFRKGRLHRELKAEVALLQEKIKRIEEFQKRFAEDGA